MPSGPLCSPSGSENIEKAIDVGTIQQISPTRILSSNELLIWKMGSSVIQTSLASHLASLWASPV